MSTTPALHTELVHVFDGGLDDRDKFDDPAAWSWELSVTPVSRWRMTRILLADAVHDRLVPVTEWLGARRSRLAHRAQDVTVWAEVGLASFIHAPRRRRGCVRLTITGEQARVLDPELSPTEASDGVG